ncbi:hypothetical protein [Oharaeibacter diazotrophicus]|uniref:Uncharacterized protein n=1 Tax=Oharaeibacter diazotrophicus TaxID=1920512 RepID=A0A4R6RK77_9HYPH|nr:hypothetical protein [Oharaeibacter diazotrophicus]TDP86989.1 hypothetical protein EDD54_0874 [Oharaeibacter diazotrophicus]BBE71068.1 hypothetical protein OHA_1_00638 [Pleomorphomonas sp. SM30]GLS77819.1 hypothetical protein GCM10007904_31560 [Oharaeibacter diazotrophicus]
MVRRMGAAVAVAVFLLGGCVSAEKQAAKVPAGKPAAAQAAAPGTALSRQALGRKLLDVCVYGQASVKDVDRQRMIADCRCAADTAMKGLEGDSFETTRSGGLTPAQRTALNGGVAACFKPKAG